MQKNVTSQKVTLLALDVSTNSPKTGDAANITAYVSQDDGAVTVLGDTSAAELDATNAPGLYSFDLTQGETNADKLVFSGKSSTANIKIVPLVLQTVPASFSTLTIANSCVDADIERLLGSAIATPTTAGVLEVDLTHIAGAAVNTSGAQLGVNLVSISGDGTAADNLEAILDGTGGVTLVASAFTLTTPITANVTQLSGDATAADNAEAFFDGTGYAGTNNVIPTVTLVNGLGAGVITATSIASDAISAAKIAAGAIDAATFAADTGLVPTRNGTAQTGTSDSITLDASASSVNQFYTGQIVLLTGGTGAGQARLITDYNGTTKIATVQDDWSTNPNGTTTFAILPFVNIGAYFPDGFASVICDGINGLISANTVYVAGTAAHASIRTALGLASANLDTQLTTLDDFLDTEIAAIKAKTDQLTFTSANKVDATLQAAADIATAVCQKLAAVILRRTMANIESDASGDTLDLSSLYGFIQQAQESAVSASTLTVKKTDGSTTLGTKTLTTSSSADPVTAIA